MYKLNFNDFPSSVLLHVFQYFTPKELLLYARVCKHWQVLLADRCLWKHVKLSPYPISKSQLNRVIRRYFNQYTKSLDLCGKLKNNSSYSLSSNVLSILAKTSPSLNTLRIEDECLHEVNLGLLLSSLKHLYFVSCEINLESLSHCENKLINLRSLVFKHCPCLTEKHVRMFGNLQHLERLELNGSYRIGDAGVEVITAMFPNLKHLTMIGCAFCGDVSCRKIFYLKQLQSLQIEEWTFVTQNGIDVLVSKNLRFLSVQCRQINKGQLLIQGSRTLL